MVVYQDQLCQELRVPPNSSYSSSLFLFGCLPIGGHTCMHVIDANHPHPLFVMVTLKGFEATTPHNINQSRPSVENALWKIWTLRTKMVTLFWSLISLVWSSVFCVMRFGHHNFSSLTCMFFCVFQKGFLGIILACMQICSFSLIPFLV